MLAHNGCFDGVWVKTNIYMTRGARAYQRFVTGRQDDLEYLLNGIRFDGFNQARGVLLDAKGENIAQHVANGRFKEYFQGAQKYLQEVRSQLRAAEGTPIEWHVAERDTSEAIRRLFQENNIAGVTVIHTPPK